MKKKTTLSKYLVPLRLAATDDESDGQEGESRREYKVTFIKAGYVRREDGKDSNWRIPAETLNQTDVVKMLDGVAVMIDHAGWFDHPSLRDMSAVTFGPEWNGENESIDGGIRLYSRSDLAWLQELLDQIIDDQNEGREVPDVGLSIVFYGRHDYIDVGEEPGEEYERVTVEITHIQSADLVFGPGAEGRVKEILSKYSGGRPHTFDERPLNDIQNRVLSQMSGEPAERPRENINQVQGGQTMDEQLNENNGSEAQVQTPPATEPEPSGATQAPPAAPQQNGGVETPQLVVDVNQLGQQVQSLTEQMDRLVGALGQQEEPAVVEGMGRPRVGQIFDTRDQVSAAYHQLMGLPFEGQPHRLSGIRELYLLLTGDRDMRGVIDESLVPSQLAYSNSGANADTTTMAELTRNVMNKAVVQQIDLLDEYMWWRRICRIENFNTLQQVSWVQYGGIGYGSGTGLPSVAEKGEYQQLYWEDARTTADWVKKGGYLPLSMEMIDRDDLQGWKDVPRQLATAAVVTLSSVVSALFTDNSGAGSDLSDSVGDGYAFNTTRGNLLTQPLDQTNWDTAVDTMYKRTQLMNSNVAESRRIAARPKFCLVPIELEAQAIQAVRSEALAGDLATRRPIKRILPEENVITVPHWTNADNWAALADPALLPFAGVAFRFGEVPELFTAADNNHILWLHDVLPIKVRYLFAVSVIETRGGVKSNMS